jgi:hypothetical protein
MGLKEKIEEIRASALKEIEDSARRGDSQGIAAKIKTVEVAERLAKQWNELSNAVDALEKSMAFTGFDQEALEKGSQTMRPLAIPANVEQNLSPRARGDARRRELLEYLSTIGINLTHNKGNNYRTQHNKLIGIAYASEVNPNRWFLGLPDEEYDLIVLMCERNQDSNITMNYFTIPRPLYDRYRNSLSISKGQRKYNIIYRRDNYYMIVPDEEPISMANHLNNYSEFDL